MWACYLFLLYTCIYILQRIVPTNGLKENDREAFLLRAACIIFPIVCQHCTYSIQYYPSLVCLNFTSLATHHYSKLSTTTVAPTHRYSSISQVSSFFIGLFFWDYGNAFLLEARRAGADVSPKDKQEVEATAFRYPSYVQDIMG